MEQVGNTYYFLCQGFRLVFAKPEQRPHTYVLHVCGRDRMSLLPSWQCRCARVLMETGGGPEIRECNLTKWKFCTHPSMSGTSESNLRTMSCLKPPGCWLRISKAIGTPMARHSAAPMITTPLKMVKSVALPPSNTRLTHPASHLIPHTLTQTKTRLVQNQLVVPPERFHEMVGCVIEIRESWRLN